MSSILEKDFHPGAIIVIPKGGEPVVVAEAGIKSIPETSPLADHLVKPTEIPLQDGTILKVYVESHNEQDKFIGPYADVRFSVHHANGSLWWSSGGYMKDGEIREDPEFRIIHQNQ